MIKNIRKTDYKEKGITLIALVVTIIILLILAGITINLVLGENGLIGRAMQASNIMANARKDEETKLGEYDDEVGALTSTVYDDGTGNNSNNNTGNNSIQIVATEMTEEEINEKGITRENDNSVIIKVTQQVQAPTKEQLQALEQSDSGKIQLQNMYAETYRILWGANMTWVQIVQQIKDGCGVTVTNISQAFTADLEDEEGSGYDIDENTHVNDAYELIIQTGAYENELTYICNNTEKTGTEVYFELPEEGNYNIVAKDGDETVAQTSISVDTINLNVISKTENTWQIYICNCTKKEQIMSKIVNKIYEKHYVSQNQLSFSDYDSVEVFTYENKASTYCWKYESDICPRDLYIFI